MAKRISSWQLDLTIMSSNPLTAGPLLHLAALWSLRSIPKNNVHYCFTDKGSFNKSSTSTGFELTHGYNPCICTTWKTVYFRVSALFRPNWAHALHSPGWIFHKLTVRSRSIAHSRGIHLLELTSIVELIVNLSQICQPNLLIFYLNMLDILYWLKMFYGFQIIHYELVDNYEIPREQTFA